MIKTTLLFVLTALVSACSVGEKPLTTPEKLDILKNAFTKQYSGNIFQINSAMDFAVATQDLNPTLPFDQQIRVKYAIQAYGCLLRSLDNPDWVLSQVSSQFQMPSTYHGYIRDELKGYRLSMGQEMCKKIPDSELGSDAIIVSLLGTDENKNGLRDDVEDEIVTDFKDFATQLALINYATKFQARAFADYRRPSRIEFRNLELDTSLLCLTPKNKERMVEVSLQKALKTAPEKEAYTAYLQHIEKFILNTPERKAFHDLTHSNLVSDVKRIPPSILDCE